MKPVLILKQVLYYAGHIIACYSDSSVVELYKINGPLVKSIDLQDIMPRNEQRIIGIDFILVPRLDW